MSYLTESPESLLRQVIAGLEGEGFPYDENTMRLSAYLATCLGDANAWKTKSVNRMLAELNGTFGGETVSHLTMSQAQLLDTLNTTLGGGGGGAYHADAVHFDGSVYLTNASLAAVDNGLFSIACWIKAANTLSASLFISDPDGFYLNYVWLGPDPGGIGPVFFIGSQTSGSFQPGPWYILTDEWVFSLVTVDTNQSAGNKTCKVSLNGGVAFESPNVGDSGPAFTDTTYNGFKFTVGAEGFVGDIADLRIMPGVSLLTDGTISPETIALFIDENGKPVDPSVATGALGAPCILFSGNASTFGTNQGTGGAFTLTGSLTNASTSPSDGGEAPMAPTVTYGGEDVTYKGEGVTYG